MANLINLTSKLLLVLTSLLLIGSSAAQTESTLHTFQGYRADGAVGSIPSNTYGGLIADNEGNLYGTTPFGGTSTFCVEESILVGCGTVFREQPPKVKGGAWTLNILYSFDPNYVGDGIQPTGGLVIDAKGNLYGTTATGQGSYEPGNIFELSPPAELGGSWTETILYTFAGAGNGYNPNGSLVMDAAGNLYGTTNEGGQYNVGTVYEVSPPSEPSSPWTESVLYSFGRNHLDGSYPLGGLIFDAKGDLYGTTNMGGAQSPLGNGTVFHLVRPSAGGTWTEAIVHRFNTDTDGANPVGSLLLYKGVLYGTTRAGGAYTGGTIYQITQPGGKVVETILYNFVRASAEGSDPRAALVADAVGNLYSTTDVGGDANAGTLFKIARQTGGGWIYSVLYSFSGEADGAYPPAPVLLRKGALYGLTSQGGDQNCFAAADYGCGTVFALADSAEFRPLQ
jgi:uncharacterized repeat protein (TIGR03803 family)